MFCRNLRKVLVGRWIVAGLLCMALVGGAAICPPFAPAVDGSGEANLRSAEFPLAALESTSPVRLEKQAHSNRLTLPRPDRTGQPFSTERFRITQLRRQTSQTAHALPRRVLPSHSLTSHDSSDSGDPLLASSPLS
jgi:hypothetical protein